jgi:hypothetical protein
MNSPPANRVPDAHGLSRLKPLGHRAVRPHPIHLGWWFLGVLILGLAVIGVWTVVQLRPGVDVVGTVSIGASAAATYVVAMLGAVALINFISWIRRSDYLWILPTDFADIPLDWPIVVAVAAGLVAGRLYWH